MIYLIKKHNINCQVIWLLNFDLAVSAPRGILSNAKGKFMASVQYTKHAIIFMTIHFSEPWF